MKIRLVVIDDSEEECATLARFFEMQSSVEVVGVSGDGIDGLEKIESLKPDVVILDLVMPKMDGFGVLENVARMEKRPKILVLSALKGDRYIERACELGAEYYMVKPYDILALKDRVLGMMLKEQFKFKVYDSNGKTEIKTYESSNAVRKSIDEKLSNIFITVGIPAHIKGYYFLREAIKMAIAKPEIINSITKQLYPEVAEKFETSSSKVERAIRHAIEVAWNRGKIENINNLFGIRVYSSSEKPTNGEFIALVADKMLIEGA